MNRRSAIMTAISACAAMLFPWRSALTTTTDKCEVDQVERIKRLLKDREQHDTRVRRLRKRLPRGCKAVSYRPTVRRHSVLVDIIAIWWDEQKPDKAGLYGCGLVLLSNDLAASMDDKKLTKHLKEAFLVAISDRYVSRQGLLTPFKGTPVWIRKGEVIEAKFNVNSAERYATIQGDLNTLGGLSKT